MVCFVIHILLPLHTRTANNAALERRVEHLLHHTNSLVWKTVTLKNQKYYQIRVCDEDTVSLLRDFPTPFTVLQIDYLQSGENLFTYRKHHSPPHIPLLQEIYWLAKSTERWKLPISNVELQTK
jgi:hypothetical protein